MQHDLDIPRLCQAIQLARRALQFYREERRDAVKEYAGSHWSPETARRRVPLNLISLYQRIITRALIPKEPRFLLSTYKSQHKPAVSAMKTWVNQEVQHMELATTLRRVVVDSLYSIGICKVALASPVDASLYSWQLRAGTPYAERIDLDDWVFDHHARDFNEAGYMGHRFRVPFEVVESFAGYTKKARKKLSPSTDRMYNEQGDERISMLGRTYYGSNTDEFEDFIDLWEIYLPRHQVIVTMTDEQVSGGYGEGSGGDYEPLRVQRWLGPYCGPYHILGFQIVPGNAMPKGPVQDLVDLHKNVNANLRKLLRQCERQKTVLPVRGAGTEDMRRLSETDDGFAFACDNPDMLKELSFGGPNQSLFAITLALKDMFSWLSGNLDIMGGLSPQSKTATQDKMLNENSSASISDMAEATTKFVADVGESLCWYWWHDPLRVMRTNYALPGMPEIQTVRRLYPAGAKDRSGKPYDLRRDADWKDLDIGVDPYSLQHQTPQMRLQGLTQFVMQIYTPLAQLMQQQGVALDLQTFCRKIGEYMDMPDLGEIITLQEPPEQDTQRSAPEQPGMPAQTQRNYVRENVPGRTEKGNNMALINKMMGNDTGGAPEPSMNGAA